MTRRGILTAGTWCLDRNILVVTWPKENGRADILDNIPCGGGSGYNMAANVKLLDPAMPVATIALVGDDADGAFLVGEAEAYGIEHSRMQRTKAAATDYTFAFASADKGLRTHMSHFGVANLLTPDHFDFAGLTHKLLHLGLPGIHAIMDAPWQGYPNGWVAVLERARAAGLKTNMELTSIEPARINALMEPCLPHLDLLIVNDHEIGGIAGIGTVGEEGTDIDAVIEAAHIAIGRGAMELVAVHFPLGGVVVTRGGDVTVHPSIDVPQTAIKGANGAGDAFAAGFIYGWHEGWPTVDALRLAHATAVASLRDITTTGSIVPYREALDLAERWGWRKDIAATVA
ncbi:carbohydrate kinase family protein [Acuticoccus sp. M5D2P5]|uniref:carbohydrate kinase family protein n=1 Tax=Acuticoccus kalidii TaxID=2910977 RepID=UPI001F2A2DB7|nr:carbohydrate kinase family protein [Acuticoccus kalidii]MCF3936740.1 carbohydrate kinase family protein [Acuticoccus kalidii]